MMLLHGGKSLCLPRVEEYKGSQKAEFPASRLKQKITPVTFSESVFYPAAGLDIEPLLRLSNLATTFLFVSLHINKETVFDFLRDMLGHHPQLQLLSFEDHSFDECRDFALHPDYRTHLNEGRCFMDEQQLEDYRNAFESALREPQWIIHASVRRRDTGRVLTLYYAVAEGLATYILLSHGGRYSPRVLITIETKVLEDPSNEIILELFRHLGNHPPFWVRGFQPRSAGSCWTYYSQAHGCRVLSPDSLYTQIAQDFGHIWNVRGDFQSNLLSDDLSLTTNRYCKMFTTAAVADFMTATPFREFGSHRVIMGDLFEVARSHGCPGDWLVGTDRMLACNQIPKGLISQSWENIFQLRDMELKNELLSQVTLGDAMAMLESELILAMKNACLPGRVFIAAWGLEDQGCMLTEFFERWNWNVIHVVVRRPCDLMDLRAASERSWLDNMP